MDAVLYEPSEKITFHIGFFDAAGKTDGQGVLETDDGAVGPAGEGLPHADIKAFEIGRHIFGHFQSTHIGESGGRIFILHPGVKKPDHKIL